MALLPWDCEELAANLVGIDLEKCDEREDIWDAIDEKYDIADDHFAMLVSDLLPLIQVGNSILTGTTYKGFGKSLSEKDAEMFVKIEVEEA